MKLNGLASEHVTGQFLTELGCRLNILRIPIRALDDDHAKLDRAVRAGDLYRLRAAVEETALDQILSQLSGFWLRDGRRMIQLAAVEHDLLAHRHALIDHLGDGGHGKVQGDEPNEDPDR